ncbi:MAG: hypothetical protein SF182_08150 [Deltaproteobacteria bacterium]|nr:hypothetical protein [Deltaproteobacteria bacterium]
MPRSFVRRACTRGALTLLLLGAALGCRTARPPVPLDGDIGPTYDTRLDAGEALAAAQDDHRAAASTGGDDPAERPVTASRQAPASAPPAPPEHLSEEELPEVDPHAAPADPVVSGTTTTANPAPGNPAAPAAAPPPSNGFALEAPSPLLSITATTPPNVAAATRLADAARLKLSAGDDGAALEQLERAIAIDSGNGYAYFFLAELHLRHRTYDQAIAFAERAAELNAAQPPWASRAYTLQGNAFEAAGRFTDARQAYGKAVRVAPNNLAAASGLARTGAPPPAAPFATAP